MGQRLRSTAARSLPALAVVAVLWGSVEAAAQETPAESVPAAEGDREKPPEDAEAEADDAGEPGENGEPPADAEGEPYAPPTEEPESARTPRTICDGRRIRKIKVEGARRVDAEDILATIELRRGVPCTDPEIARDAKALWNMGFFDDLVIDAEQVGDRDVVLTIRVTERPAIGKVVFKGNDEIDDEDIDEKVTLREGAILSIPDVRKQVDKIRDLYSEKGFFLAQVDYSFHRIPGDTNEVEVRFDIDEGEEVTVRRIRFVGNEHIPAKELRGIMQTSETGFFSFISSNDTFSRDAFDEDLTRLQAYYYDKGYLAMNVSAARVELTADRRYIDITVPIEEGPRFRISSMGLAEVDADGVEVEPLGGRKWLRKQIRADEGDWFSRSQIAEDLQKITRYYRDRGYAKVEPVPQTDLDMDARTVDVTLSIRRGPLVTIERINIQGNSKTRDSVIRREMKIVEGELYNQTKIEDSKERVQALGFFERVDLAEEEGSSPDKMVLNFEVAERATGTFQVGFGFSSIESIILTAQIQQQNLFGRGQSLALQLQLSGIRQNAQIVFTEPYLFGTPWSASVQAFKTIRQFPSFNRDSTGASLTMGHPVFRDRLRFFVQYRADLVNISARTGGFFGRSGAGSGFRLPDFQLHNLFDDGLTSSVRLALTWDSRNNRMFPSKGIFASASTEVADTFLGSDNVFVRHEAFFRFFKKLWGPLVLRLNTEMGLITSREDQGVPIFERYFLGGIFDVRGFRLNSLGPRAGLPRSNNPTASVRPEGEVLGGNLQAFYNLEVEFPLVEAVGIRGVVFTDGGNAWNLEDNLCGAPEPAVRDKATVRCGFEPRIRTSWGFGFRWFSPLGPLRFEWGVPFNKRSHENRVQFEFTIGQFF